MDNAEIVLNVNTFVALIAAALLLSVIAERAGIPPAVVLVGSGIIVGSVWHIRPPFNFSQALLFIFLPPLIFEAAWNAKLVDLRRSWREIALLAFPGTLFVAFTIAGSVFAAGALPLDSAMLLGAMVAATDPVAVIAVFRRFPVPHHVKTVVEGESVANDGVAVVIYTAALTIATHGQVNPVAVALTGVVAIFAGVAVGCAIAYATWWFLKTTSSAEYEVTATVSLAYIAYLAADAFHFSGIFACAAAGVMLRWLHTGKQGVIANANDVDRFWNASAYITNAIVFVATGLLIDLSRIPSEPLLIASTIVIVFASRAVIVYFVLKGTRERVTAFLAGMRGALPLALALALPADLPHRAEIVDGVFAVVFVTLVVQGMPLEPLVRRLYPQTPPIVRT